MGSKGSKASEKYEVREGDGDGKAAAVEGEGVTGAIQEHTLAEFLDWREAHPGGSDAIAHIKGFGKGMNNCYNKAALQQLSSFSALAWDGDSPDDTGFTALVTDFLREKSDRKALAFKISTDITKFKEEWDERAAEFRGRVILVSINMEQDVARYNLVEELRRFGVCYAAGRIALKATGSKTVLALGGDNIARHEAEASFGDGVRWTVYALSRGKKEEHPSLIDLAAKKSSPNLTFVRGKDPNESDAFSSPEIPEAEEPKVETKEVGEEKEVGMKEEEKTGVDESSKAPTLSAGLLETYMVQFGLSKELILEQKDAFNALDLDGSGAITLEECRTCLGEAMTEQELAGQFKELDLDGNGSVTFQEFLKVYVKAEVGRDVQLSRAEECEVAVHDLEYKHPELTSGNLQTVGEVPDILQPSEASAKITEAESEQAGLSSGLLETYMSKFGLKSDQVLEQKRVFDALDADGSGEIKFDEVRAGLLGDSGLSEEELDQQFKELDADGSGGVTFQEFLKVYVKAEFGREVQVVKPQTDDNEGMRELTYTPTHVRRSIRPSLQAVAEACDLEPAENASAGDVAHPALSAGLLETYMERFGLSRDQVLEQKAAFDELDAAHSGQITLDVLRKGVGQALSEEELAAQFKELDANRNGTVSFQDLLKVYVKAEFQRDVVIPGLRPGADEASPTAFRPSPRRKTRDMRPSLQAVGEVVDFQPSVASADSESLAGNSLSAGLLETYMARFELSREQVVEQREVFGSIDVDNSGEITYDEVKATFGDSMSEEDLTEQFGELDEDGSGGVTFQEFLRVYVKAEFGREVVIPRALHQEDAVRDLKYEKRKSQAPTLAPLPQEDEEEECEEEAEKEAKRNNGA